MPDPNRAFRDSKEPTNNDIEVSRVCHHCTADFTVSIPANRASRSLFVRCTVCDWTNLYWDIKEIS